MVQVDTRTPACCLRKWIGTHSTSKYLVYKACSEFEAMGQAKSQMILIFSSQVGIPDIVTQENSVEVVFVALVLQCVCACADRAWVSVRDQRGYDWHLRALWPAMTRVSHFLVVCVCVGTEVLVSETVIPCSPAVAPQWGAGRSIRTPSGCRVRTGLMPTLRRRMHGCSALQIAPLLVFTRRLYKGRKWRLCLSSRKPELFLADVRYPGFWASSLSSGGARIRCSFHRISSEAVSSKWEIVIKNKVCDSNHGSKEPITCEKTRSSSALMQVWFKSFY